MVEEKEKQVMGNLTFKDQAYLPHVEPHDEDAHLPSSAHSGVQEKGIREGSPS